MTTNGIVIVNCNTKAELAACLDSIRDGARRNVIVVDNASSDGSAEMVRTRYPWVELIANDANLGYGSAANQGIARCEADCVLLLNSDTRLRPDSLDLLCSYLDEHPHVAIVGPRLIDAKGSLQHTCHPEPTPLNIFMDESAVSKLISNIPLLRSAYLRTWSHTTCRSVPWILGAALGIRKSAFEDVGGFDTSFFMYFEEADLCKRLRASGWEIHFAPVTTITHIGGASTSQMRSDMRVEVYASMRQYYRWHYSNARLKRLEIVIRWIMLGRYIRDAIRLISTSDAAVQRNRRQDLNGWRRVLAGEHRRATRRHPTFPTGIKDQDREPTKLRRADWRFLLPHPESGAFEHMVVLGGPSGLPERLVEAGIVRSVSRSLPDEGCVDAVAIMGGQCSIEMIKRAASSLSPGGVMYCEFDRRGAPRRMLTDPNALERILSQASLSPTGAYWVAPNLDSPIKFIPIDVSGTARWYVNTSWVAGTLTHRLVKHLVVAVDSVWSGLLSRLIPWYAVTAIKEPMSGNMRPAIGQGNPNGRVGSLVQRPVLITGGHDDASRVVILPFMNGSDQPRCVLKMSRLREFNVNVEQEQRFLSEISEKLGQSLSHSVPTPMGLTYHGDLAVGAESYVDGESLFSTSGDWKSSTQDKIMDLRLAARWLTRFNKELQLSQREDGASIFIARAKDLFDRYCVAFDATNNERLLFESVLEEARCLASSPLPIVWRHNDFGPWNIQRSGGEIQVIDWELGWGTGFERAGTALSDLLYFITHWNFVAHNLHDEEGWLQGFHQLFITRNPNDGLIAASYDVIDGYLAELEIDKRFVPLILVYMLVERAVERLDRRRLLGELGSDARWNDRFTSYVNHLADHANQVMGLTGVLRDQDPIGDMRIAD